MIKIENLSKVYNDNNENNQVNALRDINLNIKDNECLSITGKSGAGKSTLLNILGVTDIPTTGKILINGVDIVSMTSKERAIYRNSNIGYVFQDFLLEESLTVEENVELPLVISRVGKEERKKRVIELLEAVGLENRINHKPSELSGGEKQRASIARALINNPDILLADEPTGNLDDATGKNIYSLMRKMTSGKVMIMVTHDKELAYKADHVIVLRDGKIVEETRGEEVSDY